MMNDMNVEQYLKKFALTGPAPETDNKILAYSETMAKDSARQLQNNWLDIFESILGILGFEWLIAIRWLFLPKENEVLKVTLI